jgi:hypothetical protein
MFGWPTNWTESKLNATPLPMVYPAPALTSTVCALYPQAFHSELTKLELAEITSFC